VTAKKKSRRSATKDRWYPKSNEVVESFKIRPPGVSETTVLRTNERDSTGKKKR
jgi:hypothetical protein